MKHVSEVLKGLAIAWKSEANQRLARTPSDPAAEALKSCATQMIEELERVDRETAMLTVEQYANDHGIDPSTVRKLCIRGLLDGAVKGADDHWRIPRDARRLAKPRSPEALAS